AGNRLPVPLLARCVSERDSGLSLGRSRGKHAAGAASASSRAEGRRRNTCRLPNQRALSALLVSGWTRGVRNSLWLRGRGPAVIDASVQNPVDLLPRGHRPEALGRLEHKSNL